MEKSRGERCNRAAWLAALAVLLLLPGTAIAQTFVPVTLTAGTYNTAYTPVSFAFRTGTPAGTTWSWAAQPGSILPPGLTLSSAGVLSGTPTRGGTFDFVLTASRPGFNDISQNYQLVVNSSAITITSGPTLPLAVRGQPYSVQLAATGGSPYPAPAPAYFWEGSDIPLPEGLSITSDGRITGSVSESVAPGSYTVYIAAYDATYPFPQSAIKGLTIIVDTPMSIVQPSDFGDALRGTGYILSFSASGGTYPHTWAHTGGTLPPGLTLDSGGFATGTLTTAGTYSFTITVTDFYGLTASKVFTLNVVAPLAITSTSPLPAGEQGVPYNFTFARSGGKTPITWTVFSGTPPPGVTLATTGVFSGTPTGNGTYNFTVQAADSFGQVPQVARLAFAVTILPPISITTTSLSDTITGTSYSQTLVATGGQTPYTWTLNAGTLPPGLTLSSAGVLSGNANTPGTYNFTVRAGDPLGGAATRSYTVRATAPLSISGPATLPVAVPNVFYSQTFTPAGGTPPYNWSPGSTPPPGLSLSSAGVLSGTPTTPGSFSVTVQVNDNTPPEGQFASRSYTLVIDTPMTITTASPLPAGVRGQSYSQPFAVSGGTSPFSWAVASGSSLPGGLGLSAGVLTGSPTTPGNYTFTIQVTDGPGQVVNKTFNMSVVNPLSITTTSLPLAIQGSAYSLALNATGGTTAYSWTAIGTLPPTVTLSSSGVLSGTPGATGSFPFQARVTDSTLPNAQIAVANLTLVVDSPMTITTASPLPAGLLGQAYSQPFAVSGGTSPYTWAVAAGSSLPGGLGLSAGVLNGSPATPGNYTFTIQVTDGPGQVVNKTFNMSVVGPLSITTTSLPLAIQGSSYSIALNATGGTTAYSWTAIGTLPPTVTLSSSGVLSGTPGTTGSFPFQARVTDSTLPNAQIAVANLTLVVDSPMTITTASPLPAGLLGQPYSQTLAVSGGTAGFTWSVLSGSLPGGLTLSGAGLLSGLPNASGTFTFTAQVTDSLGQSVNKSFTVQTAAQLTVTTTSLPLAIQGAVYSQTMASAGGTGALTWTLTGALPTGVTFTSAGLLGGTPTVSGSFPIQVRVTDSTIPTAQTATANLTLNVDTPMAITTASPLPAGIIGQAYSQTLAASGGAAPLAWSVAPGFSLPSGLAISGSGALTGTPDIPGNYTFTIRVSDVPGQVVNKSFTMSVVTKLIVTTTSLPLAIQGTPYSQMMASAGGTPPFTWTVAGALPGGLSFTSAGLLSGTPSVSGSFPIQVRVTDSTVPTAQTATADLTPIVDTPMTITTASPLPAGVLGVLYSRTLGVSGGTAPFTWSQTAGTLPPGVLIIGGSLSGTPTAAGNHTFTLQAADTYGQTTTKVFQLNIANPLTITSATQLPVAQQGSSYSFTFAATGGTGAYTWAPSGPLPPGLSLSSAGVLSGIPTGSGLFNFSVQVTDSAVPVQTATGTFALAEDPPIVIQTLSLPPAVATSAYSATFSATGGTPPFSFALQSTPPPGLSLNAASGLLSGTAPAAGTYPLTLIVTDTYGLTASRGYTLTVVPKLVITTSSLPNAREAYPYSATLTATGGSGSLVWSAVGSLPAGLTLSGDTISGSPTTPGTYNIAVQVTEIEAQVTQIATATLGLTVTNRVAVTSTSPLPNGAVGKSYNQQLNAAFGTTPYSWGIAGGALPAGLTLTGAGIISGTATAAGTFTFKARVLDNIEQEASADLAITIVPQLQITTTSPLPVGNQNAVYPALTFAASGGLAPLNWSVATGSLPAGMALSTQGVLSGTPTAAGTFTFSVQVADSNTAALQTVSAPFSLTVYPSVVVTTASPLQGGVTGQNYSLTFQATGGNPPFAWTVSAGSLPSGWTLTQAGLLGGATAAAGTYNFTVRAADATGGVGTKDMTVTVAAPLVISTSSLPVPFQNSAYTPLTMTATGGTPALAWSVSAGSLPAGMSLSGAGVLSGSPTASGSFTFTAQAVDSAVGTPQTATKQFTLTVDPQLFITTASPLPYAKGGAAYSQSLAASGGTQPFTWTTVAGGLPDGISLSAAGVLSGTPPAALSGTFNFNAQVVDGPGQIVTKWFALRAIPPLTITTASPLPVAVLGSAYSQTLAAAGGTPGFTWTVTGGSLPPGLTLNSSGVLSGTATTAGSYTFSATATDQSSPGAPQTATASFTIVAGVPVTITTSSAGGAVAGKPYSLALAATGGTGTLVWTFSGTAPAAWFAITAAGVVSGTPPSAGSYDFTVKATDPLGLSAVKTFTLPVNAPLSITTQSLPDAVGNVAYAQPFAATGGTGPYTWSITAGSLPAGLTLNTDGSLSGTPVASGTFNFTVQAKDSSSLSPQTAASPFVLKVLPPLAIITSALGGAQYGQPFSVSLAGTGGVQPYNWSLVNGGVPGLTLSPSGLFGGVPTLAGNFTVVVRLGDATPATVIAALPVHVAPPTLTISTATLPPAVVNTPYAATFAAFGAPPPYTFTLDSGSLPTGMILSDFGVLSGTAQQVGTYSFSVRATSGTGSLVSTTVKPFVLTVQQTDLTVTTLSLNGAVLGQPFAQQLQAAGGTAPYTWTLASGILPAPMTIAASGLLSGVPPAAGSFQIAVRVTDSVGLTATRPLVLTVVDSPVQITTSSLPPGVAGTPYGVTLTASGGQPGYTFQMANGTTLPAGLGLLPGGTISGTPAVAGIFDLAVTVQDSAGGSATRAFTLTVTGPPLSITTQSPLPDAVTGSPYSANLAAFGGTPPYSWSAGGLPDGISLNTGTGALAGTPAKFGSFTVSVTVTDSFGTTSQKVITLTVKPPLLSVTTSAGLGSVPLGVPASIALAAAGGAPPYSWLILAGNPADLILSPAGTLTGTPATTGTFNFTAQVTDSEGNKDTRQFTLVVVTAPLSLGNTTLPGASAGTGYTASPSAAGGAPPYKWAASGLPAGLSINPDTGAIGGIPTAGGPFTVVLTVTDATDQVVTRSLALTVAVPPLPPASITGPPGAVGPLQQPPLGLNLSGTMPVAVEGQIVLTFTPERGGPDPAVQFATGGNTVRFTIPPGANLAQFAIPNMAVQTGSLAGTIVLTASFRAAGLDITPSPPPTITIRIVAAAPGIRSATAVRTASGFTVTVIGYSNNREITQATFRFNPTPGSTLQTSEIVVPVSQLFTTWFNDPQSQPFGGQFTFVQPFNVQGDTGAIASITVTLTNALGASPPVTATLQ